MIKFQASNCYEVKEHTPAKFFFKAAFTILENAPKVQRLLILPSIRAALTNNIKQYIETPTA